MKKLIYGGLFLACLAIIVIACKKTIESPNELSTNVINTTDSKGIKNGIQFPENKSNGDGWITLDPIRLARATTHRKRDGKNCGCNECFGLCNSPGLSKIAVRQKVVTV